MSLAKRRRILIATGALLGAPRAAFAQKAQMVRRIGILATGFTPPSGSRWPFGDALRRLGYEPGKNLVVERRFNDWKDERLPALAEELVRLNVELIVTFGNLATEAAKLATKSIPIVMHASFFPVEYGLVDSLRRPGGNVTGTASWDRMDTADKRYQILKDAVPTAKRVTVLWDPTHPVMQLWNAERRRREDRNVAAIGLTITRVAMTRPEELTAAMDGIVASRPDLLNVAGQPAIYTRIQEIIAFTIKRKIVTLGPSVASVEAGALLSYDPAPAELLDRTASYVDRILRGAKPGDLPIEQATKWELVLNAKTARAIGFKPPASFMAQVTRQVE
jgi:putative ABC transport system substrate-binding protein